jgi:hypothetical protein
MADIVMGKVVLASPNGLRRIQISLTDDGDLEARLLAPGASGDWKPDQRAYKTLASIRTDPAGHFLF